MPRFGRKQPRTVPLEPPALYRQPQPDVDAQHNQLHEIQAFIQVALDNAGTSALRASAAPIVEALLDRFSAPGTAGIDRHEARSALTESVCLGLGFAEIETYDGMAAPGTSDVRIWNGVVMAMDSFTSFPAHLRDLMHFGVQTGYYVGRNGLRSLDAVLRQSG